MLAPGNQGATATADDAETRPRASEGDGAGRFPADAWLFADKTRANLLLTGVDRLEETLGAIEDPLGDSSDALVTVWRPAARLRLPPATGYDTLVLHRVDALARQDRHLLLDWMAESAGRTRVISTSRAALWPLVESGAFHDVLYYRLNIVSAASAAPASAGPDLPTGPSVCRAI